MDDKLYGEYMEEGYQLYEYEEWLEEQIMELREIMETDQLVIDILIHEKNEKQIL
jgi:hypothetical protein